jgi:hypothetical protein
VTRRLLPLALLALTVVYGRKDADGTYHTTALHPERGGVTIPAKGWKVYRSGDYQWWEKHNADESVETLHFWRTGPDPWIN